VKTGADAETLRRLESRVREQFVDGLPPHIWPSARSLTYSDHCNQSRFFVASHSEYLRLTPQQILGVFRDRNIIVHGHPFNHEYGWNLETFGRLYDIDKLTTVQGERRFTLIVMLLTWCFKAAHYVHSSRPEVRQFQGSLRDLFEITTTYPTDSCPPLNAISLPSAFRNHLVPSHELAQSRVPSSYATVYNVPDARKHTKWSLVRGKDAISPMHVDSEGFGTVIVVLHGSKYWIIATRIGDDNDICSVDSLGPNWDPYMVNRGANASRYRFEAVHLCKGDML
jgi:hypothetical protein